MTTLTQADALKKIADFRTDWITPAQQNLIKEWMQQACIQTVDVKYDIYNDQFYLQIPKENINE